MSAFLALSEIKAFLNDAKIERSCTNARLPCVKGAGTANAVTEGLFPRKTYFTPSKAQSFEPCKKDRWCTDGRLPLVRGAGAANAATEGIDPR